MATKHYRLIYNCDSGEAFRRFPAPSTEDQICMVLDELKGTAVDAFCYGCAEWVAMYPSKVRERFGERLGKQPIESTYAENAETERQTFETLLAKGTHPMQVFAGRARDMGMDFYASVRMNDAHQKSEPKGPWASRFWMGHPEYRNWEVKIWRHSCTQWYYNATMSYAVKEVRQHYEDMILELARDFDVDGLELDFCRNPFLFNPSEAWEKRAIVTRWLGEVRDQVRRIGRDRGRDLKIIVRVPSDRPSNQLGGQDLHTYGGIDLQAWIENKVGDIFVVSDFHENDFRTDFTKWCDLAHKHGVLLYPGMEVSITNNGPMCNHAITMSPDEFRGLAHNYLSQKPDGLYLFNMPCLLTPLITKPVPYSQYLRAMGDMHQMEKLEAAPRSYAFYEHLPIELEVQRPARFYQTIPFTVRADTTTSKSSRCIIRFKVTGMPDPGAVLMLLNGQSIDASVIRWDKAYDTLLAGGTTALPGRAGFDLGPHYFQVAITLDAGRLQDGNNTIGWELTDGPPTEHSHIYIHELEVRIEPGNHR